MYLRKGMCYDVLRKGIVYEENITEKRQNKSRHVFVPALFLVWLSGARFGNIEDAAFVTQDDNVCFSAVRHAEAFFVF